MIYFSALCNNICLTITLLLIHQSLSIDIDRKYVKCLVCLRVVEEISKEIQNISPSLKYSGGGYVLDDIKRNKKPAVEMRRSEVFLVELMERLCKKMNDYVRAHHRETGELNVIPLIIGGAMNPSLTQYKIVEDGDLESLEFYCESITSEYDEELLTLFKGGVRNIEDKLCFSTEICGNSNVSNEPDFNDEL